MTKSPSRQSWSELSMLHRIFWWRTTFSSVWIGRTMLEDELNSFRREIQITSSRFYLFEKIDWACGTIGWRRVKSHQIDVRTESWNHLRSFKLILSLMSSVLRASWKSVIVAVEFGWSWTNSAKILSPMIDASSLPIFPTWMKTKSKTVTRETREKLPSFSESLVYLPSIIDRRGQRRTSNEKKFDRTQCLTNRSSGIFTRKMNLIFFNWAESFAEYFVVSRSVFIPSGLFS